MSVNVDGAWSDDLRRAINEVETWIEVLHQAGDAHDRLAPTVSTYLEARSDPNEILRMIPHLAALSSRTRLEIERTLHTILAQLRCATQGETGAETPEDLPRLRSVR